MMNPEDKARWVAALRSGEYKQATGQLRTRDNKHCCLGVCLDVLRPSHWTRNSAQDEWADLDGDADLLNYETGVDIGLAEGIQEELATMNDDLAMPFTEIADWIEKNPEI